MGETAILLLATGWITDALTAGSTGRGWKMLCELCVDVPYLWVVKPGDHWRKNYIYSYFVPPHPGTPHHNISPLSSIKSNLNLYLLGNDRVNGYESAVFGSEG
jgi:hypothetical protein